MPTSNAANPFAGIFDRLNKSRLSASAIDSNLAKRTASMHARAARQQPTPGALPLANTVSFEGISPPIAQAAAAPPPASPAANAPKVNPFANLARGSGVAKPVARITPPVRQEPAVPTQSAAPVTRRGMFGIAPPDEDFGSIDDRYQDDDAPTVSTRKLSTRYSDQQMGVIECNDRLIVVDAFAGCGKTTTAVGYANHRPDERMLYLCLNKANADEAQHRFGPNVTAATTHSVAWRAMRPDRNRINNRWKPLVLMDQLRLNTARESMVTMRILLDFFNSADREISEKHAEQVSYEHDLTPQETSNGLAFAALAWKRMLDPNDKLHMPHDAYLKMFALNAPKLDYSTIIFDEAQDANPVTLQIVNGQKHSKLLCIGDRHQSIYQFRGSVNAMEKLSLGSTHLHLSQTWRFGPAIAETANLILGELKGEKVKIQGMGQDGQWSDDRVTVLSRTNAELFRIAAPLRGEGIHWIGGTEGYRLEGVLDAFNLYIRERELIKDVIMRRKFASWEEYERYAEDAADSEAKVLVKIVNEFEGEIPQLIEDIKKNAVAESANASLTLTTAHKSKGLDWDCVRISNDFELLEKAEDVAANHVGADMPVQDINLLYVAATRAKKALALNEETTKWIEDLPRHRQNREAAMSRHQAAVNENRNSILRARMSQ